MKAILITGYHYNEYVSLVDVKETDKSYMAEGIRFRKESACNDCIGYINPSRHDAPKKLYSIDNAYALARLDNFNHKILIKRISKAVSDGLTRDQAQAIAGVLGL